MTTVLVTGAGGQIGRELVLRSQEHAIDLEVAGLDRGQLDITDSGAILDAIATHRAQIVVNAAAFTSVDAAENRIDAAHAVNRDGAAYVARACREAGIPLLHLSTDYVFNGVKATAYQEADAPSPGNIYGRGKWEGEQMVRKELAAHLILRTSWLFGAHGDNFVHTILNLGRTHSELRVVADQRGGPTPAAALADALLTLARRHMSGQLLPWGTYHYAGLPIVSWHEFAVEIFRQAVEIGLLERAPHVHAIPMVNYLTPARRPRNSALDTSLARGRLGLSMPDWRAGLREVLTSWKVSA